MAAAVHAGGGPAAALRERPLRRLTVLYDPDCRVCSFAGNWLPRQRQLVPLDLVPVGSAEARRRFPALDQAAAEREITVVGDAGQLYRGDAAWLVCLWALAEYRPLAHRFASPRNRGLARAAVLRVARYREAAKRRQSAERRAPRWPAAATAAAGARGAATAARAPASIAPGWVYDRASGWIRADAGGCGDGCAPAPAS